MITTMADPATSRAWIARLREKAARERVPVSALLELTSRCNLRCVHCYLGPQDEQQRKRDQEMDTAQACDAIDQLGAAGCLYLTITGGDPMMRKDFPAIYRHARQQGLLVSVYCDGILVHDGILALFRELPPRNVEISLYGATAATYESVTRVPGSHAGAMRGIRALLDNGIRVSLKTVLLTINQHELDAMERFAAELDVPFRFDGAIFPCLPNGDLAPLQVRLNPSQVVALEMRDPARRAAWRKAWEAAQQAPADGRRVYTCGAGQSSLYIDPYAQVSPCLMTTHHRFSLREKPLRELWQQELAAVRQKVYTSADQAPPAHLRGVCAHCPGVNRLETGSETTESPFVLELARLRHAAIAEAAPAGQTLGAEHGA
ncbi:MAG: radical SAM protein [Lentisphaerae bacterium]|nr:radical SAM protein [Lentisphaerota bacterium]